MTENASPTCFFCKAPLEIAASVQVGRGESCPKCRSDVRVCYNCVHYDTAAYNECREPMAERVVNKDRANFCDYFSLRRGGTSSAAQAKADALKKLDDLFKK